MSYRESGQVSFFTALWVCYSLFIIYGTTIPFNFDSQAIYQSISQISWIPFVDPDGSRASISDLVQNILLFMPFGLLGFLSRTKKGIISILVVTLLGFLLSAFAETLQLFSPDRTTSMSDIATNSIGSFTGAVAGFGLMDLVTYSVQIPGMKRYLNIRFLYPLVICTGLVVLGALHPYDFTLDVGSVLGKIKYILKNPFAFDFLLRDEGVYFLRYFLFGLLWALCAWEWALNSPILKGILISCVIGIMLEGCQIIVSSRMPTLQDITVVIGGSLCGGLFIRYWASRLNAGAGAVTFVIATIISASLFSLSPFDFSAHNGRMNWLPFLPYYEITTFVAFSNFIESMLIYFPMGFILQYCGKEKSAYVLSLIIALIICFTLEYTQQWVAGRYADITDVIGAMTGAFAGAVTCRRGWPVFNAFIFSVKS